MTAKKWIADRTNAFDSSGIRQVFDLASKLSDPINLSIGQPDYDVPGEVQEAMIEAVRSGRNGYALTQGMPVLREKLQHHVQDKLGHGDRQVFISSGTSGGLVLAVLALVDPGDEVIIFDPFFVMYEALVRLAGGVPVYIDTYPDFRIDIERVRAAVTERTKLILFNSPANPTGVAARRRKYKRWPSWRPSGTWPSSPTRSITSSATTRSSSRQPSSTNRPSSLTASPRATP